MASSAPSQPNIQLTGILQHNPEESGRHKAMEEFLADVRIEQRHYIRQAKMLFLQRRSLVLQERIFSAMFLCPTGSSMRFCWRRVPI